MRTHGHDLDGSSREERRVAEVAKHQIPGGSRAAILALQRAAGNAAVVAMLQNLKRPDADPAPSQLASSPAKEDENGHGAVALTSDRVVSDETSRSASSTSRNADSSMLTVQRQRNPGTYRTNQPANLRNNSDDHNKITQIPEGEAVSAPDSHPSGSNFSTGLGLNKKEHTWISWELHQGWVEDSKLTPFAPLPLPPPPQQQQQPPPPQQPQQPPPQQQPLPKRLYDAMEPRGDNDDNAIRAFNYSVGRLYEIRGTQGNFVQAPAAKEAEDTAERAIFDNNYMSASGGGDYGIACRKKLPTVINRANQYCYNIQSQPVLSALASIATNLTAVGSETTIGTHTHGTVGGAFFSS